MAASLSLAVFSHKLCVCMCVTCDVCVHLCACTCVPVCLCVCLHLCLFLCLPPSVQIFEKMMEGNVSLGIKRMYSLLDEAVRKQNSPLIELFLRVLPFSSTSPFSS